MLLAPTAAHSDVLRAGYCLGVAQGEVSFLEETAKSLGANLDGPLSDAAYRRDRLTAFILGSAPRDLADALAIAAGQGRADQARVAQDIMRGCAEGPGECPAWLAENSTAYRAVRRCDLDNGMPY